MASKTIAHSAQQRNTVFNLLREPWLPVRRRDGTCEWVSPDEITSDHATNPIIAFDWPRPDFRIASLEFLIGLLATACPPVDEDAWLNWWDHPPSPETLAERFTSLASAFNLDGPGPRFMQDHDPHMEGEPLPVETLLISSPGAKTRDDNTTLFVKHNQSARFSRAAAAIALFTLQTYAPSGGSGNRVSLRGGGPMTTLVLPSDDPSLWQTLWANTPRGKPILPSGLSKICPWLAPTRDGVTTPQNTHPLQAFWGAPRRIRLAFANNYRDNSCALTGERDDVHVTEWRQLPHGPAYTAWTHPLAPYYQHKQEWLPVHPQPGGVGYRHWVGLVVGDMAKTERPATTVAAWQTRRLDLPPASRDARLLACGYDTNNSKVRSFVESEMPLPGSGDKRHVAFLARHLVIAAEFIAIELPYRIRDARYDPKKDQPAIGGIQFTVVREAFWQQTSDAFFVVLREASPFAQAAPAWLRVLSDTSLQLFDEAVPLDPGSKDAQFIVPARKRLRSTLAGYGATGKKLYTALLLPTPQNLTQ